MGRIFARCGRAARAKLKFLTDLSVLCQDGSNELSHARIGPPRSNNTCDKTFIIISIWELANLSKSAKPHLLLSGWSFFFKQILKAGVIHYLWKLKTLIMNYLQFIFILCTTFPNILGQCFLKLRVNYPFLVKCNSLISYKNSPL